MTEREYSINKNRTSRLHAAGALVAIAFAASLSAGCKSESDEHKLARMLFGEARSCSRTEKIGAAYTVLNRIADNIKSNGTSFSDTLTADNYDCFDLGNKNYLATQKPESADSRSFSECLEVARLVMNGEVADPTRGATHYYLSGTKVPYWGDKSKMKKLGRKVNRMEQIGRIKTERGPSKHIFFREKKW